MLWLYGLEIFENFATLDINKLIGLEPHSGKFWERDYFDKLLCTTSEVGNIKTNLPNTNMCFKTISGEMVCRSKNGTFDNWVQLSHDLVDASLKYHIKSTSFDTKTNKFKVTYFDFSEYMTNNYADKYLILSTDCILSGVNWVYSYTEYLYAFNYKLTYFTFLNYFFDDSVDLFFDTLWFVSNNTISFQLLWSFLLDFYVSMNIEKYSISEDWFRNFVTSHDISLFVLTHPEILLIKSQFCNNFVTSFFSEKTFAIFELLESESFLPAIMLAPQFIFILFITTIFISFYFSYYSSPVKEEALVDSDYLAANITVESEKELGSIDDYILTLLIFMYIFGWYFYINFWNMLNLTPENVMTFYVIPQLYIIIFSIPTLLLYDFGVVFPMYLKGVALSALPIFEIIYDFIALISLYVRLMVQAVRLVLMLLTYASMHDVILFYSYDQKFLLGNESLWDEISNIDVTCNSITYFTLFIVPGHILYWQYELFHVFFVLTGQFVAYIAMIFWLFQFLFTLFTFEVQEKFFGHKKWSRQKFLYKVKQLTWY